MAPLARSILVTGANRGIGLELIKQLLTHGDAPEVLFAACRSPDQAEELKKIAEKNQNLHIVKLDVCSLQEIKTAKEIVERQVGDHGLNLLINNAGFLPRELEITDVTAENMMQTFSSNVIGPTMIIKEFLPLLRQASANESAKEMSCARAAILNMSTKLASIEDNGMGKNYSYRSSKIALNMVNKNLSLELKDDKILAVLLHPGWVKTDMGGANAITTTEESVAGLLKVAQGLTEKDNGLFYDFKGASIPW